MISFRQIEELIEMKQGTEPIVNLYLGGEGNRYSKKDYENTVKDLFKEREKEIEAFSKDKAHKVSLEKDSERIRQYVKEELDWKGKKGLAIFSCFGKDFWQVYSLPRKVKNLLVVDRTAYIRPLMNLFDEYRRFCTVLVDKTKARTFEIFLGEIEEHTQIVDQFSKKERVGGWKGYGDNKIERHLTEEIHRHFKKASEALMDLFKQYHFDWMILGGHHSDFSEFEKALHPFLKERMIGHLETDLHISKEEVLEKSLVIEHDVLKRQGEDLLKRLNELSGEKMAVSGVLGTLAAFRRGQIHSLVVSKEYLVPGMKCLKCHYLDRDNKECPLCKEPLHPIPDLIDDLIEAVVGQGCKVEYVWDKNGRAKEWGGVGAILRFKV
ncbi:MAG: hypothetical protein HYS07_10300 [Chlamydiae bacterium]|nr:hypothetical protein [Chlamydiota bacterium]MBI3277057.1 hypothetical protein [Chlamydiota bacterium]